MRTNAYLIEASAELVALGVQFVALVNVVPELFSMWLELVPVGIQEP